MPDSKCRLNNRSSKIQRCNCKNRKVKKYSLNDEFKFQEKYILNQHNFRKAVSLEWITPDTYYSSEMTKPNRNKKIGTPEHTNKRKRSTTWL